MIKRLPVLSEHRNHTSNSSINNWVVFLLMWVDYSLFAKCVVSELGNTRLVDND